MTKIKEVIFVLSILIVISCSNDEPLKPLTPEPVAYDTLMPLNYGNYWLYSFYERNVDSTLSTPSEYKYGFIIDTNYIEPEDFSETKKYQISYCDEKLTPIDDSNFLIYGGSKLVYENEKGFYYSGIIRNDSLVMNFDDLIFPYPVEEGDSVRGHVFYYSPLGNYTNIPDDVMEQYICVATDSLISTPIGDFSCIVYKMAYNDFPPLFKGEVYYFVKPGIGIVGMIQAVYYYNLNKFIYKTKILLTDYQIYN